MNKTRSFKGFNRRRNNSYKKKAFILTLEELLSLEKPILDSSISNNETINTNENSLLKKKYSPIKSIIIDEVQNSDSLENQVCQLRAILRTTRFRTALTEIPMMFYDYFYKSTSKYFTCFTAFPNNSSQNNFYKRVFDSSEIIYYSDFSENHLNEITELFSNLNTFNQIKDLFKRNIYDHNYMKKLYGLEYKYISEKIHALFNILRRANGELTFIYFSKYEELKIVYEIIKLRTSVLSYSASKKTSSDLILDERVFTGTDVKVNIRFVENIPKTDEKAILILFCLIFILLFFRSIKNIFWLQISKKIILSN